MHHLLISSVVDQMAYPTKDLGAVVVVADYQGTLYFGH